MTDAERNYEIYNKEMLAITEALKDWRYYLKGLPQPFEIWMNHQNLTFWHETQHLTWRQAYWALLLADYNFMLVQKPGTSMLKPDVLSHLCHHEINNAQDNLNQVVLKLEHFRKIVATAFDLSDQTLLESRIRNCAEKEIEVAPALSVLKIKGPHSLANSTAE